MLQSLSAKHETQVADALILIRRSARGVSQFWQGEENDKSLKAEYAVVQLAKSHQEGLRRRNENVLESLRFDNMSRRESYIEEAYPKTNRWALQNESLGLRKWLQSDNGIFWISGKAGSGKSTLMKFLCGSKDTHDLLRKWSRDHELVFANFYFWYLGTGLQRSIQGLFRSILHQILSERIELAHVAFPKYYNEIKLPYDKTLPSWKYSELLVALERVARHESDTGHNKKFCFFIDGLDEYHGNHLELVGLLRRLAGHSDFKLCVSSRPWNAFRSAFESSVPRIRLEDLTRPDINHYVKDRIRLGCRSFGGLSDLKEADLVALMEDIVNRAEGVFLWVFLVVKSVLDGLAENDSIAFLRHRVHAFPSDLEEFFDNIVRRVDPVYKPQSSQALKLACKYVDEGGSANSISSWLDYWLISQDPQGLADPRFPYKIDIKELAVEESSKMLRDTRTFLSATCKDLLYLPRRDLQRLSTEPIQVQFLHRTVYDFLNMGHMKELLEAQVPPHFRDSRIIHLLNLARVKFCNITATRIPETAYSLLESTANISLVVAQPELCNDYVEHFEAVALHYSKLYAHHLCWLRKPDMLAPFVAFHCKEYVLSNLDAPGFGNRYRFEIDGPGINTILIAALGESPLNSFELADVNLEFMETLMGTTLDIEHKPRCSIQPYVWHTFIKKFADSSIPVEDSTVHDGIPPTSMHRLEHAWNITKLFLRYHGNLTESVCSHPKCQSGGNHQHSDEVTAAELVKQRIPLEWRKAFGDKRLLE